VKRPSPHPVSVEPAGVARPAPARAGVRPARIRNPGSGIPLTVFLLLFIGGCGYYSFTGAAIPQHLREIAIPLAEDNSTSPFPTLGDNLTRQLIDRFVGQTRLSLQPSEDQADVVLTSRIDRYMNQPASVGAGERAELNRITISVSVSYFDRVENEELMTRTFSAFSEYDPIREGLDGEQAAAQTALLNIANDIFTAATSNW
jgi:hypothetical protein